MFFFENHGLSVISLSCIFATNLIEGSVISKARKLKLSRQQNLFPIVEDSRVGCLINTSEKVSQERVVAAANQKPLS